MSRQVLTQNQDETLLGALRAATYEVHERLHVHPMTEPLTSDTLTREHYINVLKAFYGFYVPCEAQIKEFAYASRLEWLTQDLQYFEVDLDGIALSFSPPDLRSAGALLGYHYVTEGSTLGSQVISKQLRKNLNISPDKGGRFFHAYGKETGVKWKNFRALFERQSAGHDGVIETALATFLALEKWLWHCHQGAQT